MKNVIRLLVLLCISTASSCREPQDTENCHFAISFSNHTEKRLRVNTAHLHPSHFPNAFALNRMTPYTARGTKYVVNAGEQNNRSATRSTGCIENTFWRFDGFLDTLFLFIFDANVIERTPWDIVARDYLVLRRYDLTLEDLQRLNWQVTYPPDERMRDVRMWPPFGE